MNKPNEMKKSSGRIALVTLSLLLMLGIWCQSARVAASGHTGAGQQVGEPFRIPTIAAGGYHSLALKSDGTVVAWGYNTYGQATVPANLSGVTALAGGSYHSLALKSDGTVVAWGLNSPALIPSPPRSTIRGINWGTIRSLTIPACSPSPATVASPSTPPRL